MDKNLKNHPNFDGFSNIRLTNRSSFFSLIKRINAFFLFLFSSLLLNIEAKNFQQIPASKLKVVVANAPKPSRSKTKAKTVKTKVKKAKAAPKDTLPEIDPANTNSPLFEKNQN